MSPLRSWDELAELSSAIDARELTSDEVSALARLQACFPSPECFLFMCSTPAEVLISVKDEGGLEAFIVAQREAEGLHAEAEVNAWQGSRLS